MISGIILAAGESKRMGALKQLLPLEDATILERTIDNVTASAVDETIVVLGYRAEEIRSKIGLKPVKIIHNTQYQAGMSTSLIAGVIAVANGSEAILIALADQPFVPPVVINQLLEEFKAGNKGMVIPVFRGRRGHPVIISLKYRSEFLALTGDVGAREIILRHKEDILEVKIDSPSVTIDIDTPEEYQGYRPEVNR